MPEQEEPIPIVVVRCPRCGEALDYIPDVPLREAVLWGYLAQKEHDQSCEEVSQ